MAAQRFPWDFDGIVAGAPDIDQGGANMRALWIARVFLDNDGKPLLTHDALHLTHEAVLKRCDMDDGVKDGIIGDPLACNFDPAELLCKSGQTSGCLTPAQVEVVRKLYSGPMTSDGKSISTGGFLRGSELGWEHFWPAWGVEQFFKYGGVIPPVQTSNTRTSTLIVTTSASDWRLGTRIRILISASSKEPAEN
jgi:hypothetical protein